ncbi:MAG: hypothetical protein Q8P41_11640 [Pseudomonadota bacterium]|nr:hypothetical protein [Pseudomonadota bacterium]
MPPDRACFHRAPCLEIRASAQEAPNLAERKVKRIARIADDAEQRVMFERMVRTVGAWP